MVKKAISSVVLCVVLTAALAACVQMPTEKQSVVDQRPQITFRIQGNPNRLGDARVFVDELDMGRVQDYLDGQASLRIMPGTHMIKVQSGSVVHLMERAYLGDGVTRAFNLAVN